MINNLVIIVKTERAVAVACSERLCEKWVMN
jgi:hypothetical protein